jgi:alcohol dehydrogenase class IV
MRFEFSTAGRILFGPGRFTEVPGLASTLGRRALLVSNSPEIAANLSEKLTAAGVTCFPFLLDHEPDMDVIIVATRNGRESGCDLVLGIGGGSALDTGKAVAALLSNPGDLHDYLEIIGAGRALENPSVPYIAIPTTAGTGSEVTRNAVVAISGKHIKVSLRSPHLLPRLAVVDPELTYSLPPDLTASTGLDALTQLIEPFVCNAPTPLTDAFCRDGIPRAARALPVAVAEPRNPAAREDMSLASLYGGLALANARLGAVHGLAAVIGGRYPAPHGAICARLLPFVMQTNLAALREQEGDSSALGRYREIARLLTGDPAATAESGSAWVRDLVSSLAIPSLTAYGLERAAIPELTRLAQEASSTKGNPIPLSETQLVSVLENAM